MIRFGVIGTGARAHSLVNTIVQDKKKRGDLVALCDLRPQALEEMQRIVKRTLSHDCKTYSNYLDLLDNKDVDAVIIATPDFLHHSMAVEAFNAKKHVFLEKPVGINLSQMIDILQAVKRSGKTLEVGYVLRYSPFYIEMKKMIESGEIGRPMFCQALEEYYGAYHFNRGWWRKKANTGGIMIQKICHDMDLHCWMFGKPKRVAAFDNINEFKPGNWASKALTCSECSNHCPYFVTKESRTYSDECVYNGDHDVADNAQVIIEFENGVNLSMGMTFFNSHGQDDRHWKILGSKAEISGRLSTQIIRFDPRFDFGRTGTKFFECADTSLGGHGGGDDVQTLAFIDAISEGREAKAGMTSAYWSSILVMGAQMAADSRTVVDIKDLVTKYPFPK